MAGLSANIVPHCTAIGLQPTGSLIRGQVFEGSHRGRSLTVTCVHRTKTVHALDTRHQSYDGHRLFVHVGTTLQTRLLLADESRGGAVTSQLNERIGVERIESLSSALDHLEIWAGEPNWVRQAVANQEVHNMLVYLLPSQGDQSNAKITLGPESFEFGLNTRAFPPEQVGYWLDSVFRLIEALESGPAPTKTMELTRLETQVTDNPKKAVFLLIGGILALAILLSVVLVGLAIVLGSG